MGLDMYAYYRKQDDKEKENVTEIAYWRKHNALHDWMQRHSSFQPSEFNCIDLILTKELLEELKKDIIECNLQCVSGFFFGDTKYIDSYKNSDDQEYDLNFVNQSLEILKDPEMCIYYTPWW